MGDKSNARKLLQRGQPADEDLVARHLNQISHLMKRFQVTKSTKISTGTLHNPDSEDKAELLRKQNAAHLSHAEAVKTFAAGGLLNPLQLADMALKSMGNQQQ